MLKISGPPKRGMNMTTYRLYELRTKNNKSQEDIAAALGTSQPQYSKYERGVQDLTGKRIIELCRILDCTADELLGIEKPQP